MHGKRLTLVELRSQLPEFIGGRLLWVDSDQPGETILSARVSIKSEAVIVGTSSGSIVVKADGDKVRMKSQLLLCSKTGVICILWLPDAEDTPRATLLRLVGKKKGEK